MGPKPVSQAQSSFGRNGRQTAASFTQHIQQPIRAQAMLSNSLPAESIHKASEGSSLLAELKSLPQHAQHNTLIGTELARGQGMLEAHHAQRVSASQHAERRQRSQRADHSTHAGFTATVSMTARCTHRSPESCNSNSSIVNQCCATMHSSEVNSSLSIHASLSPRKLSKAVKPGRQGEVAKQSVLPAGQHESVSEKLQLQEQLPKQSSIMTGQNETRSAQLQLQEQLFKQSSFMTGQNETRSAQLQLQEQLPMHASPNAAPVPTVISAGLLGFLPVTTQSPQPVTSHNMQQPVPSIVSSKSLSRASSIVAAQQAVSRSSCTVCAEANSLQVSKDEVPRVPQGATGPTTHQQQQAEADSCSTPAQPAQRPEPVCSESSASSTGQPSSKAAAGRQPVERKPSLLAVLRRASSETIMTSASQVRAGHDGRLGAAQQAAAQAQLATLPGSDSRSSARHRVPAESSASQPRLAALAGSGSTSSARHADHTTPQLQLAAVSGSGGASSARHGMQTINSCQVQPQLHQQTGPDTARESRRQQAVSSSGHSCGRRHAVTVGAAQCNSTRSLTSMFSRRSRNLTAVPVPAVHCHSPATQHSMMHYSMIAVPAISCYSLATAHSRCCYSLSSIVIMGRQGLRALGMRA